MTAASFMAMEVSALSAGVVAAQVEPRPLRPPDVLVRVEACGVCRADVGLAGSAEPAGGFPIVPGHEVAGTVDAVGSAVESVEVGERVAVGWFGDSCGHCRLCGVGDVVHCPQRQTQVSATPGGGRSSSPSPSTPMARSPEQMPFDVAAPFECAGVTTFKAIRHGAVPAGGRVRCSASAASATWPCSSPPRWATRPWRSLVATDARRRPWHWALNTTSTRPGTLLRPHRLHRVDTRPAVQLLDGLDVDGRLTVVGMDAGHLALPVTDVLMHGHVVTAQLTGSPRDTEDALAFAVRNSIRPLPLHEAATAIQRLRRGSVRFRVVLDPSERP